MLVPFVYVILLICFSAISIYLRIKTSSRKVTCPFILARAPRREREFSSINKLRYSPKTSNLVSREELPSPYLERSYD